MTAALVALGIVAIGGAAVTYVAMEAQAERAAALMRAAKGPQLVERLRAGVFATVMESRGLYIAKDRAHAEAFARDMRADLAGIQADWQKLLDVLPAAEKPRAGALGTAVDTFVQFRTELAQRGVEDGPDAADQLGNNDANRAARQAFGRALDELQTTTLGVVKGIEVETVAAGRRLSVMLLLAVSCAVALTLAFMLWFLRRSVVRPMKALAAALSAMAHGGISDVALPETAIGEIAEMGAAARLFLEKLRHNDELERTAAAAHTARDLQVSAMENYTQDFGQSVAVALQALAESVESARDAALTMADASRQTRETAQSMSEGAEDSARNLEAVATATGQLTASVGEISRQVAATAGQGRDALSQAHTTDAKMTELTEAAVHIDAVMRLIADIAGKTNLLALNATIEAARAGEAGKGFAVVASEVKALAQQTAKATGQIKAQVTEIQDAAEAARRSVAGMHDSNRQVAESAASMAEAVHQQGAATREIAGSVQRVVQQNAIVTEATRQVMRLSDRADAAGDTMRATAEEVSQVAMMLKSEVEHFLAAMRADDNRRLYKRIPGRGFSGTVRLPDGQETKFQLFDISRSGAGLICSRDIPHGQEIEMCLSDADGWIPARVVRVGQGMTGVVFRQEDHTVELVDKAIEAVQVRHRVAA